MELANLEIDQITADGKCRELRRVLRKMRHEETERRVIKETEAMMRAYREIAKAVPVIDIHAAIAAAGFFSTGMPRAAVIGSKAKEVQLYSWSGNTITFISENGNYRSALPKRIMIDASRPRPSNYWELDRHTPVPPVPVEIAVNYNLDSTLTLFEVEKWSKSQIHRDPFLLKHLGGPFFAVLEQWDVSDIEAAMMRHAAVTRR